MVNVTNIATGPPNSGQQVENLAIGSPGLLVLNCKIDVAPNTADLGNIQWRFQPAQWAQTAPPSNWPPNSGTYYEFDETNPALGFEYTCVFQGSAAQRMGTITIRYENDGQGGTDVFVRFYILNAADLLGVVGTNAAQNQFALLKDAVTNTAILSNNNPQSVYGENASIAHRLFLRPAVRERNTGDVTPFEATINNRLKFYDRPIVSTDIVPRLRNGQVITEVSGQALPGQVSGILPTTVRLRADDIGGDVFSGAIPSFNCDPARTEVFAYLIRIDKTNSGVPFWDNYELQYAICGGVTSPLSPFYGISNNGVWSAPSTGVAVQSGDTYEATITINPALLDPSGTYRIIHIWRVFDCTLKAVLPGALNPDFRYEDFSFISEELTVNTCGFAVAPELSKNSISDYFSEFGPNVETSPMGRLRSRVVFNTQVYDDSTERQNSFRDSWQSLRARIYALDGANRQVMAASDLQRGTNGVQNTNEFVGVQISYNNNQIELTWDFRVRNDAHVQNIFNETASGTALPANSNQDWVGRQLFIEYFLFAINTNPVSGEETQETFTVRQSITVRQFSTTELTARLETPESQPARSYCVDQAPAFLTFCAEHSGQSQAPGLEAETNFFIPIGENQPGNPAQTNEENAVPSPQGLRQINTGVVQNPDTQFGAGDDTACGTVDTGLIQANTDRIYYGIQLNRGYALSLQSENAESVVFPHIDDYIINCDAFTVVAWVWLNSVQECSLISKGRAGNGDGGLSVQTLGAPFWELGAQPRWRVNIENLSGNMYLSAGWSHRWQPAINSPLSRKCEFETLPGTLMTGQWHMLAWVRNAGGWRIADNRLYIDGALSPIVQYGTAIGQGGFSDSLTNQNQCSLDFAVRDDGLVFAQDGSGTSVGNAYWRNDGPITIGADYICALPRSEYFPGGSGADLFIKNVQIYRRALTAATLADMFSAGPNALPLDRNGLLLLARMNHDEGTQACDYSDNVNNGFLVPFNGYDVPINSVAGCAPTQPVNYGYTNARTAISGGAWVRA